MGYGSQVSVQPPITYSQFLCGLRVFPREVLIYELGDGFHVTPGPTVFFANFAGWLFLVLIDHHRNRSFNQRCGSDRTERNNWQLRDCERIIIGNGGLLGQKHFLIGITRLRNEALILRDTLDYVGKHLDAIIAYDDASTDRTLEILRDHPKVALVVTNGSWEQDIKARRIAEGRHRGLLLQIARAQFQFDWIFCFDADERVTGDLRGFTEGFQASNWDGVQIQLFDAYMTPDDCAPYHPDCHLLGFRRFFGPEQRNILMLWRWDGTGAGQSLLPALRQVTVGRALGGDLRLLHSTFSVRYLRTKMAGSQRSSNPYSI